VQQAIGAHEAAGARRSPTVAAARPEPAVSRPLSPAAQAQFDMAMGVMAANFAARAAAAAVPPIQEAPEVPSLVAAINARRSGQTTYNLDAPVFGGGPRPRPTVAAAYETIDEPPSLTDAIRNGRTR
jgi:hypothetical protein